MKRLLLVMLTVCLLLASSAVWAGLKEDIESDEFVFRRVKWGMTVEQVRQSEQGPDGWGAGELYPIGDAEPEWPILVYCTDKLFNSKKTLIEYQFSPGDDAPIGTTDGLLDYVELTIYLPALGQMKALPARDAIKKFLSFKYGAPNLETDGHYIGAYVWNLPEKSIILPNSVFGDEATGLKLLFFRPAKLKR